MLFLLFCHISAVTVGKVSNVEVRVILVSPNLTLHTALNALNTPGSV